jgi:hypothetical protein
MSESMAPTRPLPSAGPITLDDIRHKALHIRDEVKEEVTEQVASRGGQMVAVGAVVLVAIIGLAYLAGTAAGRRAAEPQLR